MRAVIMNDLILVVLCLLWVAFFCSILVNLAEGHENKMAYYIFIFVSILIMLFYKFVNL